MTTQGHYDTTITTVDCDSETATIQVSVSPGEWAGVNLTITAQGTVIDVLGRDGDPAQALADARALRDALSAAIAAAETHTD